MNFLRTIKNKLAQIFQYFNFLKKNYVKKPFFQGMLYLDNSVISELRKNRKSNFLSRWKRQKFIKNIIKKYEVEAHQFLITDKLFIEIIHKGKIRSVILKNKQNKKILDEKKRILKTIVEKKTTVSEEEVKDYIEFLEDFFSTQLQQEIPKNQLEVLTKENLKKYPFVRSFKNLELMVVKQAAEISNSSERYREFIATLVRDSVIRCALEMLDVHEIKHTKVTIINCSLASLERVYAQLLIKYVPLGVLSYELNLLMSGIYVHGQAKFKTTPVYKFLRFEDDFADSEHQYFVFYGNTIDGKRFPVTVITTEISEKIQKRHEFYFSGVSAVNNNMRKYSQLLKDKPERLLIGRAISVNFEKQRDEEISPISVLPKSCYKIERADSQDD